MEDTEEEHARTIAQWLKENEDRPWGVVWTVKHDDARTNRLDGSYPVHFKFKIGPKPKTVSKENGFIPLAVYEQFQKERPVGHVYLTAFPNKKGLYLSDFHPWNTRRPRKPGGFGALAHWLVKNHLLDHFPGHQLEQANVLEKEWESRLVNMGIDPKGKQPIDETYELKVNREMARLIKKHGPRAFHI